jgi:hypothetical protein
MALDMNALKAKLNKMNKTGTNTESFWKPTEGKTTVRIVPLKDNPSNPFIELYFHYLGNKTYLSPISNGNRDPIAEFADEIASGGTKEDYAQARPFRPKPRTLVPVIVRGEEDKGVRFWSFGKTVFKQLLEFISDEEIGDITDIKNGRDLVVTYVPQEKSDTSFAKTTVMYKPSQTPLSTDVALAKKFLSEQPNVNEIYTEPTYAELKLALEKYLDPDATSASPKASASASEDEDTPSATATTKKPNKSEVMDQFDELFD